MQCYTDAQGLQMVFEGIGAGLVGILGDYHTADIQADTAIGINHSTSSS